MRVFKGSIPFGGRWRARSLLSASLGVFALGTAGCGEPSPAGSGTGGAAMGSGGVATGGSSAGGAPTATGGTAAGGSLGAGGSATGGTNGSTGGASSGGTGSGGDAAGGSGSGGGPSGDACTRELLEGTLDDYFIALEAHDASSLTLSPSVRFTENAEEFTIGEAGLWTTAGAVQHSQHAVDLEVCTIAAHAVIPDGSTDIPVAIRLKLDGLEITEAETIVARPGDFTLPSNTDAIIDLADEVGWDVPVPEDQRNTREEIISWMDKYFRLFPQGVCNVTSSCTRLENGGGSYSCGGGASCSPNQPGPEDSNLDPRLILADVEMGVGVGFTIYNGHTDMHMFKMIDGEVHGVQVVLSQSGGESGWD